jgi:uncharacterized protein YwgA
MNEGHVGMTRYQLAKLVQWAGKLRTRKRMQKVAYLLQAAGLPLAEDYRLHRFGPYSQEVAQLSDEMVQLGVLQEECVGNTAGQQYNYVLTEDAKEKLTEMEATPDGKQAADAMAPFETQARQLFSADLRELEVASTIVYFRRQGYDGPTALEKTCRFKCLRSEDGLIKRAEKLARQIVP